MAINMLKDQPLSEIEKAKELAARYFEKKPYVRQLVSDEQLKQWPLREGMRRVTGWVLEIDSVIHDFGIPFDAEDFDFPREQVDLFLQRSGKVIEKEFWRTFGPKKRRGPKGDPMRWTRIREAINYFRGLDGSPTKREFRNRAGFKSNKEFDDYLRSNKESWKTVVASINYE